MGITSAKQHDTHPLDDQHAIRLSFHVQRAAIASRLVLAVVFSFAFIAGLISSGIVRSVLPNPRAHPHARHIIAHSAPVVPSLHCPLNPTRRPPAYDLPTLFGVPTYLDDQAEHNITLLRTNLFAVACRFNRSIAAHFASIPSVCARWPYQPHLHSALDAFIASRPINPLHALVRSPVTATIHVDADELPATGEVDKASQFAAEVRRVAKFFRLVVIVVTGSSPDRTASAARSVRTIVHRRRGQVEVVARTATLANMVDSDDPDADGAVVAYDEAIALLASASTVLVHQGPVSALLALAVRGRVMYTSGFHPYSKNTAFRWQMADGRDIYPLDSPTEPRNASLADLFRRQLDAFATVDPSCCAMHHFGRGDGEKVICDNMPTLRMPGCWLLSIGSKGDFTFEKEALERWGCKSAIFDCTGDWKVPEELVGNATLTKLCIGGTGEKRPEYRPLRELIELGSEKLGFGKDKMPALLKLDAEGHEFPVFHQTLRSMPQHLLPQQIVVEVHLMAPYRVGYLYDYIGEGYHKERMKLDKSMSLITNLTNSGYVVVHREDNWYDAACTELTLVKREELPPVIPAQKQRWSLSGML